MKNRILAEFKDICARPQFLFGPLVFIFLTALFAPVFLLLLIPAVIFLTVLYGAGKSASEIALKTSRSLVQGTKSQLEVCEPMALASALVMNDWGVVYASPGKRSAQISWDSIRRVRENELRRLYIEAEEDLEINLAVHRYTLVTETIQKKIPHKTDFLIDANTGESRVCKRLEQTPFIWKARKKLIIDANSITIEGKKLDWNAIRVEEILIPGEFNEVPDYCALNFFTANSNYEVSRVDIELEDEIPNYGRFELLKIIVSEKIPRLVSFTSLPWTPQLLAIDELERSYESLKVGLQFAIANGKLEPMEEYCKPILRLIEKYKLEELEIAKEFMHNYALLKDSASSKS